MKNQKKQLSNFTVLDSKELQQINGGLGVDLRTVFGKNIKLERHENFDDYMRPLGLSFLTKNINPVADISILGSNSKLIDVNFSLAEE